MNKIPSGGRKYVTMKKAIAYYRVSTGRQQRSGLGLEAQKKSIADFAAYNDFVLTAEFIEAESGKRNDRNILNNALIACKRDNAILLIAKLDRLSRNVAFIASLMESAVDFKVVDNPFAEKFTLHILAAVAQKEREDISQRTTAALAAAKQRGVILGRYGREILSKRNKKKADVYALSLSAIISDLQKRKFCTVRAIAAELNRLAVPTFYPNGKWHICTVHNLLKRLAALSNDNILDY